MSNTGSAVASIISGANTSKPNIVIKSVGNFRIKAQVSSTTNYAENSIISSPINVDAALANIEFSPIVASLSPYIYNYGYLYPYPGGAATVTNNVGENILYSIVTADSTLNSIKPSNVAKIDTTGSFLTTVSCGVTGTGTSTFRICAIVDAIPDSNFSSNIALSDTLTIIKANPKILQYPEINITPPLTLSTLVYGQQYTINSQPITVTGIATQFNFVGSGASSSSLSYGSYCINVPNSKCYAEYRLRFSNGIVSNLTIQSNSPQTFTNPDISFALTNVPSQGVTAILQGKSLYPDSDNLWYDVNVPEQFITQDKTSIKFNGSYGTGNFKSTPSLFQNSINTMSSNTDVGPSPTITYKSTDETIAVISGTTVKIVGLGNFQIITIVSSTTNYNQISSSTSTTTITYGTIRDTPTLKSFPTIPQILGYGGTSFTIIPSTVTTSNTDGPLISYSTSNPSIATISGTTIKAIGVVNGTGMGNYQIIVKVNATKNFNEATYTFPSPSTYYNTKWSTPTITFPSSFLAFYDYGSTYNFVAAILSNNDPSQTITYGIVNSIPVVPSSTAVAAIVYKSGVPNPSVVINSTGTFQIQAYCSVSSNGFYNVASAVSPTVTITNKIPIIAFNNNNYSNRYNFRPETPYTFTTSSPIASITNNNVQALKYSIVDTGGITPSTVAMITLYGTSLTTTRVGSFRILATAFATPDGNYGKASLVSEVITVISGVPIITTLPTLPSTFVYGNKYDIPASITTSNTDIPGPTITYLSPSVGVVTISGNQGGNNSAISTIYGKYIDIIGLGWFQITIDIGATTNYLSTRYIFPSAYNAIPATPTITFPSNFGSGWNSGGTYDLTTYVSTNAAVHSVPNQVTYSIAYQSVSNIANITSSGSQIKINYVGTFQIQANLNATSNFTAADTARSDTITISPSNVSLTWNNFPINFVYAQPPFALSVQTTNTDSPGPVITYSIDSVYGNISGSNNNVLTIKSAGATYIYVSISATPNFTSATKIIYINIAQGTPDITVNNNFITTNLCNFHTSSPPIYLGSLYNTALISHNDNLYATYIYSSSNSAVAIVEPDGNSYYIKPGGSGSFHIDITARMTNSNYRDITVSTGDIYVSAVPEIIIFNNSRAWPPMFDNEHNIYAGDYRAEPGLIIGFQNQGYPYGFANYSAVTITDSYSSLEMNAEEFWNVCSLARYAIIFGTALQGTSGRSRLSGGNRQLTPQNIVNIGYVTENRIANDIHKGKYLIFRFTGLRYGNGPPSPVISWSPGSWYVPPGEIRGYNPNNSSTNYSNDFYSNPPRGITVNKGYYTAGWSGYGGAAPNYNSSDSNYFPYSVSGSTVHEAWGLSGLSFNNYRYDKDGNAYYIGIPKILYNSY